MEDFNEESNPLLDSTIKKLLEDRMAGRPNPWQRSTNEKAPEEKANPTADKTGEQASSSNLTDSLDAVVTEMPAVVVTLGVASMLPSDWVPWPWLHEMTDLFYSEVRADPSAWAQIKRRITELKLLVETKAPEVAHMPAEVASAVRKNLKPEDAERLLEHLRVILVRRLNEFKWLKKQMIDGVLRAANGGLEVTAWTIPSAQKVMAAVAYNTYVQAIDGHDGSFGVSLRKGALWEEDCLWSFVASQLAGDAPQAIEFALRADFLRGNHLTAESDRIITRCKANPEDPRMSLIHGLLQLNLAHHSAASGSWRIAYGHANSAVDLFTKLRERTPDDADLSKLLEEAQKNREAYDD